MSIDYSFHDLESYSETPIKFGSHRYAQDCEIMLWAYALNDEPAEVWDLTSGAPMPAKLKKILDAAMAGKCYTVWHNGMNFDTVVLKAHGYDIPLRMIVDTMVMAYQHSLPGALGDLSAVFGLSEDVAKDKDGKRLVQLFCKPRPKNSTYHRADSTTHPEDWAHFVEYCRLDVEAERALFKKMPKFNLSKHERDLQILDAEINRRGMLMDVELANAAVAIAEETRVLLARRTREQTDGAVEAATQRDALLSYFESEYGVTLKTMTKAEVEKRINDDTIPEPMRELLRLRLQSTKTSVQKFAMLAEAVGRDGRLRGCLQFRGASRTGRFSGRLFQPQNLPRPTLKQDEIDFCIEAAKAGTLTALYDDPMEVLTNCLRSEIIAPVGKKLVVADYSNVEGRVLAWAAGEEWKIQAFRDFDEGHGHDLYKLAYSRAFGIKPEDVSKKQRQVGKVLELALGYGGGAPAFARFAKAYGIDLHDMAKNVRETISPMTWREAEDSYEYFLKKNLTGGLHRDVFIACDALKRAWRATNPKICALWNELGNAVMRVIDDPMLVEKAGPATISRTSGFLLVELPSGRKLCYPSPRPSDIGKKDSFTYLGINQMSRKWVRLESYGAKACIAKGTPVLCRRGWTPIEDVTPLDEVWDGVEWVHQEGAIDKGTKQTMTAYGVRMTPDHKVLTTEGWCCASQSKGFSRADCRIPDGYGICRLGRAPHAMEVPVLCLREDGCSELQSPRALQKGQEPRLMRMQKVEVHRGKDLSARHERDTALERVALHERALRDSDRASLEELRGARNHCLQRVERIIREVLRGHGTDLQERATARPNRQREGLLEGQLPLGNRSRKLQQPAKDGAHRREAACGLGTGNRDWLDNSPLPTDARMPEGALVRQAQRDEQVYDLVNCGPRHRFVVLGEEGPLIVHNCENLIQAIACDLLCDALLRLDHAGYKTVLTVHDEAITEAPDTADYSLEKMSALMTELPTWATGLPLAAAGYEAYRYKKD